MGERPKRMDLIPPNPIPPFQQGDELFFKASSSHPDLQYIDPPLDMLLITDPPFNHLHTTRDEARQNPKVPNSVDETCNQNKKKKIVHRDLERQRRQEMASLYAKLRSLLPSEYLKGKRAISDHMNGAANYIQDLRKRIQQLGRKRDRLRETPNSGAVDIVVTGNSLPDYFVTVQPCLDGVEVIISCGLRNGELLPLSRVLRVLVDHGFSVISCLSTRRNERSLHTILSEVSDLTTTDLSSLQQILTDLIASSSSN